MERVETFRGETPATYRRAPGLRHLHHLPYLILAAILVVVNVRARHPGGLDAAMAQLRHLDHALRHDGAERMQAVFPEGYVFTWALFGLASAQVAMQLPVGEPRRPIVERFALEAVGRVDSRHARHTFVADMQPSWGAFHRSWSLYLRSMVVRALGPARPSREWRRAFEQRCDEFAAALEANRSPFLCSYPGAAWPADTAVGVAAPAIHDRVLPPRYAEVIARWIRRAGEHLPPDLLALSHGADRATGAPLEGVRGSSQALMSRVLVDADPAFSREQHAILRSAFMGEVFGVPGVREYPRGRSGGGDIDSGPILLGSSGPALVLGMASAGAHGDLAAARRILCLIEVIGAPVELRGRRFYAAGILPIGDAFLAWARTTPAPVAARGAAAPWVSVLSGRWVVFLHLASAAVLVLAGRSWWRGSRRSSGGTSVARQPEFGAGAATPP